MTKSLNKEKFREEIHQEVEDVAYMDPFKLDFIRLLLSIGTKYTIVSSVTKLNNALKLLQIIFKSSLVIFATPCTFKSNFS